MKIVNFPSLPDPSVETPGVGEENQFASSRGLRFGPLSINKTGLTANNGTVDAVVVDKDGFHGFDDTGAEKIRITPSGAVGYGTNYTSWTFTDVPGGTIKGAMGYDSSDSGSYTIMGTNTSLKCGTLNAHSAFYASSGDLFIACGVGGSGKGIYLSENGGTPNQFSVGGATAIYEDGIGNTVIDCGISTKTAIVPTSKGYRALYCAESPEVWFFDFARVKKTWKFWKKKEVLIDNTFLEVTSPPYIFMSTMDKNIVQIWGKRKGVEDKRFEYKSEKEYKTNNEFWSTPEVNSLKTK